MILLGLSDQTAVTVRFEVEIISVWTSHEGTSLNLIEGHYFVWIEAIQFVRVRRAQQCDSVIEFCRKFTLSIIKEERQLIFIGEC
jgi:hypothetical protein